MGLASFTSIQARETFSCTISKNQQKWRHCAAGARAWSSFGKLTRRMKRRHEVTRSLKDRSIKGPSKQVHKSTINAATVIQDCSALTERARGFSIPTHYNASDGSHAPFLYTLKVYIIEQRVLYQSCLLPPKCRTQFQWHLRTEQRAMDLLWMQCPSCSIFHRRNDQWKSIRAWFQQYLGD